MKRLRQNNLIATHMENGEEWLEALDAGEPSGDACSEVKIVPKSFPDDDPMP